MLAMQQDSTRKGLSTCCYAHELRRLYFCPRGNDFGLSGPLGLRGHGERVLELLAEDDILDKHALDGNTPAGGRLIDNLANGGCDLLAALNDVLEGAGADDMAQGGLGALDEGLADVGDAEGGLVGRGDVVVDDRGEPEVDVVLKRGCQYALASNLGISCSGSPWSYRSARAPL